MYPIGNPCSGIANVWEGTFTPQQVVGAIIDNVTPINKNNMRLSVGQQISLVQNFVNANYLAREDVPVNSGFMNYLYIFKHINAEGSYPAPYFDMRRDTFISLNTTGLYFQETRTDEGYPEASKWLMQLLPSKFKFYFSHSSDYSDFTAYRLYFYESAGTMSYTSDGLDSTKDINILNRDGGKDLIIQSNNIVISGTYATIYSSLVPGSPDDYSITTKSLGGYGNRWAGIYTNTILTNKLEFFDNSPASATIANGATSGAVTITTSFIQITNNNNSTLDVALTLNTSALTVGNIVTVVLKKSDTYTGGVILGGNISNSKVITLNPGTGVMFVVSQNKLLPLFPDSIN